MFYVTPTRHFRRPYWCRHDTIRDTTRDTCQTRVREACRNFLAGHRKRFTGCVGNQLSKNDLQRIMCMFSGFKFCNQRLREMKYKKNGEEGMTDEEEEDERIVQLKVNYLFVIPIFYYK